MNKFTTIITILIIAAVAYFGGTFAMKATSDDKFCNLCHEWMNPMTKAYHESPHGGASTLGVKAKCVSCHLPHDSVIKYTFKKAMNGISEVTYMMLNDPKKMDWQENRKRVEEYVFDSGCLDCHTNILNTKGKNENVDKMHELYKTRLNTSEKVSCVSCHKGVGHENLGKILYEIKHPPVGSWSDEEKGKK